MRSGASPRSGLVRGRGLSPFRPFLRICRDCGVPYAVSRNHVWEEHGRILSRDTAQRLIIVERKVLDGIFRKAAERIGDKYKETFIKAKAFDAAYYVRSVVIGWRKVASAYPLARKPFYQLLCDHARILGMADATLESYRRGKEIVISCTQCYNEHFFSGDILGAVYAGEGKGARVDVEDHGDGKLFVVTISDGNGDDIMDRYSFSWEVPLPGYISYKRCSRCNTPFPISFFTWDIGKGIMTDTHNGEQVTLIDVAGINAAYEEIKSREGKWVEDFMARTTKDMVDTILPGLEWKHRRPEEKIRDLFFMAYRGMGNPIFTEPFQGGLKVRIENPFNYPMVAGIATSFLARGRPVNFEWERSMPGRLEVYMDFSRDKEE